MKPSFALNLSHEGIVLMHRSPRGTWTVVGDVKLDDPAFRANLSFLRSTAVGLEGKGFVTRLIIPNSQILYREIHVPAQNDDARRAAIRTALQGQTPYDVADLTFDWRGSGPVVDVAVVANETLDEAEEFAVEHRFNPISFVGRQHDDPEAWEPFFGRTDFSYALLGPDADVRDTPLPVADEPPSSLFEEGVTVKETSQSAPATANPDEAPAPQDQPGASKPNMFADRPNAAPKNIFADTQPAPPVRKPDKPDAAPAEPVAPETFSSTRSTAHPPRVQDEDHPVSRIAPRIEFSESQAENEPTVEPDPVPPTTAPEPRPLVADAELRSEFLAEETDARAGPAMVSRAVAAFTNAGARGFSVARGTAAGVRRSVAGLAKRGRGADTTAAPDAAAPTPASRRRFILAGSAGFAVITLAVIGWVLFAPSDRRTGESGADFGTGGTTLTTAASRGVHADNRARARPSDFATIVARSSRVATDTTDLPPVRPERRSLFEGSTDPDAGLPDTARSVLDPSERELADIRAAGLPAPTQEELAETTGGRAGGGMDPKAVAVAYADTGALVQVYIPPTPRRDQLRDHIFVAAVDRALGANDAIILPDFNDGPQDDQPRQHMSPLGPDVTFDLDDNGLVKPTSDGALNPDGILVRSGKPEITPPPKPETEILVPPNPLLALTPKARPADLKTGEDAIFVQGRLTMAQLRGKRGKVRPVSEQSELAPPDATPSELAVLTSFQPAKRPSDFSETVEKAMARIAALTPATTSASAAQPAFESGPVLPTRANVAKTATIKNAINLGRINLIGVYGTASNREALLRLPSGRYVRVSQGDRIDGGRVAAIGETSLSYVKSGRNRVLKIPQ